jgi:type III pantothenate kinase
MVVAILDIGNTNLKIYHILKNKITGREIISWKNFDVNSFIPRLENAKKVIMTSVVPEKKNILKQLMIDAKIEVQIVGEDIHPDITIKIEKPETLGNDRLIGAYEGYAMVQGAAIVIDLGTALTIDFVSSKNEFLGGIIAPGLRACAQSLETTAPLLAGYQLFGEVSLPGKNTGQAIRSGLVYLISGGIEKVVNEFKKLDPTAKIIATGGDFERIKDYLSFEAIFEPDLLANGMIRLLKIKT